MITFNEAVDIAERIGVNNGIVTENNDSYIFNALTEDFSAQPCVILKATGEDLTFPDWLSTSESVLSRYVISHRFVDGKWEEYTDEQYVDDKVYSTDDGQLWDAMKKAHSEKL